MADNKTCYENILRILYFYITECEYSCVCELTRDYYGNLSKFKHNGGGMLKWVTDQALSKFIMILAYYTTCSCGLLADDYLYF